MFDKEFTDNLANVLEDSRNLSRSFKASKAFAESLVGLDEQEQDKRIFSAVMSDSYLDETFIRGYLSSVETQPKEDTDES